MAERLKLITWLWEQPGGRSTYRPWHVLVWRDMIRRHIALDCTLAVVTNIEGNYGDVEVIPPPGDFLDVTIPTWRHGRPQCFRRLSLFRPDAAALFGADRVINMDLDIIVTGSLDGMFGCRDDFRIARGTASSRAFNGSVFMLRLGSRPHVFAEFTPERAAEAGRKHIGSDQSWMARCLAGSSTWGPEDGLVAWQHRHLARDARIVTFPGSTKPATLVEVGDRYVATHYRRSPAGRCLVLGYGPTVWSDAERVLDGGSFDAVIASPEAAEHWPGPLLAVVGDDDHAERIAAMHGLDVIWCGRQRQDERIAA